jgi:hypothetical protein
MSKYYTIKITGGTSPGPYTIYLNSNLITVATRYPQLTPASNLTYIELTTGLGVSVVVPDDTATLFLYNTYPGCLSGITLIPTTTITYKDFCLRTIIRGVGPSLTRFLRFTPNTPINGYPSWIEQSDSTITVTYNVTESRWKVNGFSLGSGSIVDIVSPTNANPPNNWTALGNPAGSGVKYLSECPSTLLGRSTYPVSINQPTCLCDGSVIFNVNLDNPPYSYSIDDGVTYSSSPIFTNLCSGIYILSVVDSLGETFSDTITLNKPEMATTYSILLNTTISTPVSNELSLVKSYETTIQVIPPLPDGATITFDLIHTNSFYSSPTSGTSVLTTGTVLNKNVTPITIGSTITGQTQSVNTTPGCQSDFIYQSNIDDTWNSLTLTNTDTITISTTTRVDKTTTGLCVVGYSNDSYSISNAVISGCDCCSLIVNT